MKVWDPITIPEKGLLDNTPFAGTTLKGLPLVPVETDEAPILSSRSVLSAHAPPGGGGLAQGGSVFQQVKAPMYPVISTIKDVRYLGAPIAKRIPYKVATDVTQALDFGTIPGVGAYCNKLDNFTTSRIICPVDASHPVIERHGNSCKRIVCPVCYTSWLRQAADRVGSIVFPYYDQRFSDYAPSSVVLSISDDEPYISRGKDRGLLLDYLASKDPAFQLKYLHKFFNDRLLSYGAVGGVGFVHLVRTAKDFPRFTTGLKRWQAVRSAGYAWKDAVRYSPHYHAITYGFLREPEEGEFLYKKLGTLLNRDEVEKVAYYSLDHAAIAPGKKDRVMPIPSYFGALAKGKWRSIKTQKEFYDYLCVVCGVKMIDEITRKTASGSRTMRSY